MNDRNINTSEKYKAELIMRISAAAPPQPIHIKINGGCDLERKYRGFGDLVAESIYMRLPSSAIVTANWIPKKRRDESIFTASFAGYEEPSGDFIRLDNAHNRDTLHVDMDFRQRKLKHSKMVMLSGVKLINRRRIALQSLMGTLERDVNWQIPIWFYMPWCFWWPEFSDFGEWLRKHLPPGLSITEMCEAVLAYLSFNVNQSQQYLNGTGTLKHTIETIEDAIDRITLSFSKTGEYEFSQLIRGHVVIIPFPMYAPSGSEITGLIEITKQNSI